MPAGTRGASSLRFLWRDPVHNISSHQRLGTIYLPLDPLIIKVICIATPEDGPVTLAPWRDALNVSGGQDEATCCIIA